MNRTTIASEAITSEVKGGSSDPLEAQKAALPKRAA